MATGSVNLGVADTFIDNIFAQWDFSPVVAMGNAVPGGSERWLSEVQISLTGIVARCSFTLASNAQGRLSQADVADEATFVFRMNNQDRLLDYPASDDSGPDSPYSGEFADQAAAAKWITDLNNSVATTLLWDTDGFVSAAIPFAVSDEDHNDLVVMGHELKDLLVMDQLIYRRA